MITLDIRGLDVDVLLESLSEEYSTALKRIWRSQNQVNAVFVRDELVIRTMSEQAVVVIVEHDVNANTCKVQCLALAGGSGLLRISWGSHDAAESTFRNHIKDLALKHGWRCEILPMEVAFREVKCPICRAIYSYPKEKVLKDGSVICQNCGMPFVPSQPARE